MALLELETQAVVQASTYYCLVYCNTQIPAPPCGTGIPPVGTGKTPVPYGLVKF